MAPSPAPTACRPQARGKRASIPMSAGSKVRRRGVCWSDSLRAGSIAAWRGRAVAGLDLALLGRGFAAALGARNGPFHAWRDAQALHPPRIGVEHLDLEIAGARNHFAAHRQAADMRHQIAAQRFDLLAGFGGDKILADYRAGIVETGAGVGDEGIIGLPHDRGGLVAVMFVVDLADDLLDDVLDRD